MKLISLFVSLSIFMIDASFASTKEINCRFFAASGTEQSFDFVIQDTPHSVKTDFVALSEMKEIELSEELTSVITGISLTETLIDVEFYSGKIRFFIPHTLTIERKNIKTQFFFDGNKTINQASCRLRE